ncbi:MAG: N-6 DNA methylase [Gemmatimonadota bacterium]
MASVPPDPDTPLWQVGMLGSLPCWWTPRDPRSARKRAHRLARSGHLGLILSGETSGQHELIVTIRPCLPFRVVPPLHQSLGLTRMSHAAPTGSRLGDAIAFAKALDLDAQGRETFQRLRGVMAVAAPDLRGSTEPADRQTWLLLQVTRLLFLRFVESEGWLDGSVTFLRDAVDQVLTSCKDPGRELLEPLFFGTLNRPRDRRNTRSRQFGTIPFLNGGLFEPHALERAHAWRLPRDRWRELLDAVINSTEVSLDLDAHPDTISPEMLGRILEGLMDPEERSRAGVFYTPPALVEVVVREAVACHMAARLGRSESQIHDALDAPDPDLVMHLRRLRVLDPAVGSGAFLVGALHLLRRGAGSSTALTRRLITSNLHGIDRNPTAVRVTELRLWLELLRTMRGTRADAVDPLPNLDAAIRAGDALIDPLEGRRIPSHLIATLQRARHQVEAAHGSAHHAAQRRLVVAERAAIDAALGEELARLTAQRSEALDAGSAATLFPDAAAPVAAPVDLDQAITRVTQEREALARDDRAATFAIESAWPDVLADGGFDLVIGNPPWVRSERLPPLMRGRLAARYRWWHTTGTGWPHPPDLAVAFVERAFRLIRPGGTFGLLVPGKLATTAYASVARAALVREATIHTVADLADDPRAAFDATTYPLALVASRTPPVTEHLIRRSLDRGASVVPQSAWRGVRSWVGTDGTSTGLLRRLASDHPTVATTHTPSIGVKTGANAIFLDPPDDLDAWTRPAIRGRDIGIHGLTVRHRILWPIDPSGTPCRVLSSAVQRYLAPFEARLRHRADQVRGPWWQIFRIGPAASRWRVIWPDIATGLRAISLESPEPVPLNSCYVVPCLSRERMLRLAAWLSVSWIRALARMGAERAAGGHHRFGARVVAGLPCPEAVWNDRCFDPTSDATAARRDERAAELLGLDQDHRVALAALAPSRR